MIRIVQLLVCALLLPFSLAQAQSRDVYTVNNIPVDETAETVIEAQQAAFAAAKLIGAQQMIDRITLAEDRAGAPGMMIDQAAADLMAAAVDVEEETRGAGRYRGKLAVLFNPANVRAFLDQNSVPYTDQQAALGVLIPVAATAYEYAWNAAWPDRSAGQLAPTVASRSFGYQASEDWLTLGPEASLYGASRAIVAELLGSPGAFRVELTVVTASGRQPLGRTGWVGSLGVAVRASGKLLDETWKQSSIVRDTQRSEVQATVLYTSIAEWNTLRSALAQSPLISGFTTKAVARDGAVVSFTFAGDGSRLISDLRDRGVSITSQPIGYVLTSALTAPSLPPPSAEQ